MLITDTEKSQGKREVYTLFGKNSTISHLWQLTFYAQLFCKVMTINII